MNFYLYMGIGLSAKGTWLMKKFLTVSIYISASVLRRQIWIIPVAISSFRLAKVSWPSLLLSSAHWYLLLLITPGSSLNDLLLFFILIANIESFSSTTTSWHQTTPCLLLRLLLLLKIKAASQRLLLLDSCPRIIVHALRIYSAVWVEPFILIFILGTVFWRIRVKIIGSCCKLWSPRPCITVWGCRTWNSTRESVYNCSIIWIHLLFLNCLILLIVKVWEGPRLYLSTSIAHSFLLLVSVTVEESSTSIMCHKPRSATVHCICSSRTSHSDNLILTANVAPIYHRWRDAWFIRISEFAVKMIRLIHCYHCSSILFLAIVLAEVL